MTVLPASGVLVVATGTGTNEPAGSHHTAAIALPVISVPQPPTAVTGVSGVAKVTVSWAAQGDDGGSPVQEQSPRNCKGYGPCAGGVSPG